MKKNGNIVFFSAVLLLFSLETHAVEPGVSLPVVKVGNLEYVSLYSLSEHLKLDNSFDIVTQRGRFYRGSVSSVYQVGLSIQVVNGRLMRYSSPVVRGNGEVLFPEKFCRDLIAAFYPEAVIKRDRDLLQVAYSPERKNIPVDHPDLTPAEKTHPTPSKNKISFIIIDPGHGGKDPGAIGKGGIKEKTINLSLAKKLESSLKKKLGPIPIILTRRNDRFLELATRTEIANRYLKNHNNGIFISIHVNASMSPKISGFETYFLSQNPSNEEARTTAALENDVIILEDSDKRKSYNDIEHMEAFMFMTQIQKESALLAESIQREMDRKISEFKSRNVRKADFYVLRGALMPAALVEVGYITNSREAGYLRKDWYQNKVADGIGNGIVSFIKKYNELIKK
ncbi:MAG TPA: N-acetylmuramoyl-L-alanine amidase [Spirochaetes bacterium]|nr:N-acetylmuramoyl-L-alanine amidase [Spirochaetota bacterium]